MLRRIVDHLHDRLCELTASLIMLGLALHIALWPEAVAASDFRAVLGVMNVAVMCAGFALAGAMRLAAIVANGAWPLYGPLLRAAGALAGAMIWFQIFVSLVAVALSGAVPSPNIPAYLVLSAAELVSMYRALVLVHGDEAH